MIGRDEGLVHQIDVAAAELGVEHRHVGDVFEDELLDIRPLAEIVRIGDKLDPVARHPVAPFEGTSADGRLVEGRRIRILRLAQNVLGHHEGLGEEGEIGREGAFHPPGDFRRRDHRQISNEGMAARAPGQELRIDDEFDRVFDVFRREGLSVMPFDVVTQLDAPVQAVFRNAAILDARDFRCEIGLDDTLWIDAEERVEDREGDRVVDLVVDHQRIEDRRLLRHADDHAALGAIAALLSEGCATEEMGRDEGRQSARRHQAQGITAREAGLRGGLIRHDERFRSSWGCRGIEMSGRWVS